MKFNANGEYVEIKIKLDGTEDLLQILLLAQHVSGTTMLELKSVIKWLLKHVQRAIRSAIKTSVASSWHFISTS